MPSSEFFLVREQCFLARQGARGYLVAASAPMARTHHATGFSEEQVNPCLSCYYCGPGHETKACPIQRRMLHPESKLGLFTGRPMSAKPAKQSFFPTPR